METQTCQIGPPRLVAAIVERLIPASCRPENSGDLHETYASVPQYLFKALRAIPVLVARQVRRTFDWRFVAGEAFVLYISFAGAALLPLSIVIVVALVILTLRDAYIDPARRSQYDAVPHAIVASTFVFLSQVLLGMAAPLLTLPYGVMIRGAAISLMMMSAWRLVFYLKKQSALEPDDPRRATSESYRATWRINILWFMACVLLILTNPQTVPSESQVRDVLFGLIPVLVFGLAYRLKVNKLDRTAAMFRPLDLSNDAQKRELSVKRDTLWITTKSIGSRIPWSECLEALFFFLLALPVVIALWRWWSGDPAAIVDEFQLGANVAALVSLSIIWIYIKKLNQKTARSIQEQIDVVDAEKKK